MRDGFVSFRVSRDQWNEIFREEPMIVKVVCKQCGEEFENEVLHKKCSPKKFCPVCVAIRRSRKDKVRYRRGKE